ncbi:MAG TPA: NADH-quinone oxidoreductase subunit NuoH [Gemmataceae bacterium]|jgi:NADH-quinone oxidoreductase subunit H|nr:NADH-quinone oxidoreductase subunit NuoH [Gemmataceae bacterium]
MHYDFNLLLTILTIVVIMGVLQGTVAYLILLERKVAAYVQDRLGPNRVGPWGLLQPIADGLKFLFKEEIIPSHVDRWFYLAAPAIAVTTATLAFAVVPFGPTSPPPSAAWPETPQQAEALARTDFPTQVEAYNRQYQFVIAPHVDVGIVFVFAVGSLAVYGIILGGWSSANKYSFLGSLRSSAQIISYEIPLGMSVLGVVLLAESLNLEQIIHHQTEIGWHILYQPLAFLLFLTSIFAETNRLPFDLPEAEQELVGGYHTEYSGLKFGMFFLGEYTHVITTSFLAAALFLGGWHFPWIAEPGPGGVIVKLIIFAAKMFFFILFYMFVRWTLPRFRFDQLMGLAWQVLIPLALVNLLCVMAAKHVVEQYDLDERWQLVLLPVSLLLLVGVAALVGQRPERPRRSIVVIRGHERVEMTTR